MLRRLTMVSFFVLLVACTEQASQSEQFALELIEDNFRSTDFSALVEVTGYSIEAGADEADGLETVLYSAHVLEVFAGDERSSIEFVRYIEPGEEPDGEQAGTQIISLCRNEAGTWYLPDIGFELPDSKPLRDRARQLGAEGTTAGLAGMDEVAATACVAAFSREEDSSLRILLISGQMNQYHNADLMDRVLTQYLEETGLFTVTQVNTPAAGEDMSPFAPDFAAFDAVVLNYDGDDWPASTRAAFERYMREGGGLVSVHSSDNAFPTWRAFLDMTALGGWGGRDETWGPAVRWRDGQVVLYDGPGGASHPPQHDYLVTVRDFDHPVTEGLPESWLHPHDELYTQLRGPAQNMQLLATGFADPEMEGASGENEPVLFTVNYGAGRVFHTTLGHIGKAETEAPASVRCVGFMTTFQRGAEWAASGAVTLGVPADFPAADAVSARP